MVCRTLARANPQATREELIAALIAASPNITERKGRRVEAYAARTVDKVLGLSQVVEARRHG
jgi:hypothetical protein